MTPKQISSWTKAIFLVLENKTGKEKEEIIGRLILAMKNQKKEYLLRNILKEFGRLYSRKKRIRLLFSREQSRNVVDKVREKISRFLGVEKTVDIGLDKELIGGFQAKTENLLIEASIKDFLDELKTQLIN